MEDLLLVFGFLVTRHLLGISRQDFGVKIHICYILQFIVYNFVLHYYIKKFLIMFVFWFFRLCSAKYGVARHENVKNLKFSDNLVNLLRL